MVANRVAELELVQPLDVQPVPVDGKNKVGRPRVPEIDKVLSNGFYDWQWKWIKREAKLKGIDAAQYQRMVIRWWIDSVEASRNGSPATPEDDAKFERLIKRTKTKKQVPKSKPNKMKRRKQK